MQYEFHPLADIFPLIEGAEFDELVADIGKLGLITPIWLHTDGRILDGRNRYRACVLAGREPRFETWNGDGFASDFVWSLNYKRRHLDGPAKQLAAGRYAIAQEGEARERQGSRTDLTSPPIEGEVGFGASAQKAADKFGVGRGTVERAVKVVKDGAPELAKEVERGNVSVSLAAQIAELPKEEQVKLLSEPELIKSAQAATKKHREKKAAEKREENKAIRLARPALPAGKFETIVIDPPWKMEKIERDVAPDQVAFEYPTMTEDQLREFGSVIDQMAADDCHLFMWTTQKFLPLSLQLLECWGFRYVFHMVWHKNGGFQPYGLPQYNHETVLYGRRGTPVFPVTTAFPTCFSAKRREHSRKPDEFYDIIRHVTDGPRIDVFNRGAIEGFASYGNETEKFVA